jgi:hypothetical protein
VRAPLAGPEQDRDDAVAIRVPYRIFDKSDREGGIPQGKSPFRFLAEHIPAGCRHPAVRSSQANHMFFDRLSVNTVHS